MATVGQMPKLGYFTLIVKYKLRVFSFEGASKEFFFQRIKKSCLKYSNRHFSEEKRKYLLCVEVPWIQQNLLFFVFVIIHKINKEVLIVKTI